MFFCSNEFFFRCSLGEGGGGGGLVFGVCVSFPVRWSSDNVTVFGSANSCYIRYIRRASGATIAIQDGKKIRKKEKKLTERNR